LHFSQNQYKAINCIIHVKHANRILRLAKDIINYHAEKLVTGIGVLVGISVLIYISLCILVTSIEINNL